ncbi:2024_t:CDS:1, partial [Dentiscutata erythropus]
DLYNTVMTELLGHNNNLISNTITSPNDLLQNYHTQIAIAHQYLHQSKKMGNRKAVLWYIYYLGEILENIPSEERPSCSKQLSQ